jgi:hypothetical protein
VRAPFIVGARGTPERFCQRCAAAAAGASSRRAASLRDVTRRSRIATPARSLARSLPRPPRRRCRALHSLSAFDGGKRTCARALAAHNDARSSSAGAADDDDHLAAAAAALGFADGSLARVRAALRSGDGSADSAAPAAAAVGAASRAHALPLYAAAAAAAPRVALSCVTLKLQHEAPTELPRGGLRAAAARAFAPPASPHEPAAAQPRALLALEAAARPGCTLLTLYAVVDADDAARADVDVHASLRAMMAEPGPAGEFMRSRRHVTLTDARGVAAVAALGQVPQPPAGGGAAPAAVRLPPMSPLAALCTAPVMLTWRHDGAASRDVTLRCVLHGQQLRFADGRMAVPLLDDALGGGGGGGHARHFLYASGGVEGAALLCASRDGDGAGDGASGGSGGGSGALDSFRVVLLTRDADIVAEVCRTEAALQAMDDAPRARVEASLLALGHALRPGCAPSLAARAAAGALAHGWRAAAARVLASMAAMAAAQADPSQQDADADADEAAQQAFLLPHGVTLLHIAAGLGDEWAVRAVLRAGGRRCLFGAPQRACATPARATPLHAAVAAAAEARTCAAVAAVAALAESAAGAVAWCGARCGAAGATPADVAAARLRGDAFAGGEAAVAAAALRALDATARARVAAGARAAATAVATLCDEYGVCLPCEQVGFGPAMMRHAAGADADADALHVGVAIFSAAAAATGVVLVPDMSLLLGSPLTPQAAEDSHAVDGGASSGADGSALACGSASAHAAAAAAAAASDDDRFADAAVDAAENYVPMCYTAWLLRRFTWIARLWALEMSVYFYLTQLQLYTRGSDNAAHASLAELAARHGVPSAGGAVLTLPTWKPAAAPLFGSLIGTWHQQALQLPIILAMLLPLLPGAPVRLRAWQRRHAVAVVGSQHVIHLAWAGFYQAQLLQRALPDVVIVWPVRVAFFCAVATFMAHVAWPLPARASAAVLALRATPLLLAAATGGAWWLHTPPTGVAMQLGAIIASAAAAAWRERRTRPHYDAYVARAAARLQAHASAARQRKGGKHE